MSYSLRVAAKDVLGRQWTPPSRPQALEYPTKGWRKTPDRVTAQQHLLGASRGYDPYLDAARKGISPNLN